MSKSTSTSTKIENVEFDEIEYEFLNNCNINDIPIPGEWTENYLYEIREVMKSGCNRQIAEYSLKEYNIESLKEKKENYIAENKKLKEKINPDIDNYFNNKNNKISDIKEIDQYEEEIEDIMEEKEELISKLEENKTKEDIKQDLMKIFANGLDNYENKEDYISAKNEYIIKRDAIIESALRLVKKIVNNEDEYKKFHKDYYGPVQ